MASQPAGVASQGPLVSVIIPFYNGEVYISEALDSALHQTYRNVEIIVVDDASTVDPKPRLASYGDRIFYIRRSSNGGVAASRNTGIRASHGEFIAFLDQDDLWLPERLARSVDELRNAPELGMVVTNTLIQDERRGVRTPHWRSIT
ncbi:MAG: glycosyltransferase family 2 protein, partial [Chloroflexi bacterium]|nr:glycosyltransferase family 2 protein [Chloroflexota bacterium]